MSDENSEVIKENEICAFSELVQLNISKANKKGDSPIKAEKWNEQLLIFKVAKIFLMIQH